MSRPTIDEMRLANLLLTSYINGSQDTNKGTAITREWYHALEEDRARALHALAQAVSAHNKLGTAVTKRNRDHARRRILLLGQTHHLSITGNTVLLPKDCPLHFVDGRLQLEPIPFPTNPEVAEVASTSGNTLQEMPPGERRDLLSDPHTIPSGAAHPEQSTFDMVDDAERAWERVLRGVRKAKREILARKVEAKKMAQKKLFLKNDLANLSRLSRTSYGYSELAPGRPPRESGFHPTTKANMPQLITGIQKLGSHLKGQRPPPPSHFAQPRALTCFRLEHQVRMTGTKKVCSEAQLAALARYRQKHKGELQQKARERMARRRAQIRQSEERLAEYQAKAHQDSARFRASNGEYLRRKAVRRRSKASIAKIGYDNWHAGYKKRHPSSPSEGDAPSEHNTPDPSECITADAPPKDPAAVTADPPPKDPAADDDEETLRRRRHVACEDYETKVNFWLDHCDPTTAPDYVPTPGQQPFWQRGRQRWY
ncbi:hypothetical protein B0H13DRAFT_1863128 [Mycena leptocephala]|nr:hypothetical protein B0H13DRAFT_1863128 [Mycena leptocephala]